MELHFESIQQFEEMFNDRNTMIKLNTTECDCGEYLEMQIDKVTITIGEYKIEINECPIMLCEGCGYIQLCPSIPQDAYYAYFKMQENGKTHGILTRRNDVRFSYAEEADFKYDSRDLSIPGRDVDLDPTHPKGFSCPVYFDRKVLNAFFTDDEYELDFFSETYGSIAKLGKNGWKYEWNIVFGINKNNKVIIFLGDLDQIEKDDRAIYWLKSYNIKSDHCLVHTEFYQAQLNCVFSDPIKEKRIISLRNAFFKKMEKKYGVKLFHLEEEVEAKGNSIEKPINYSKREIEENIIVLDGVLNEGIDCDELRKLCMQLVNPVPKDIKKLKTRKLLEAIISISVGDAAAKEIIAPLFYLNNLRVCFAHLIPQSEIDKYQNNIVAAFGLSSFDEYKELYDTLIDKLYNLYTYLNITEI